MRVKSRYWMGGAAALAVAISSLPAGAATQSKREAELEARVTQLEALVARMQSQMESSSTQATLAATQAQATADQAAATASEIKTRVAAWEARPAAPAEGFRVANNTTIKIGGFIKTVATFSRWDDGDVAQTSLGRDFYLPSAIPVRSPLNTRESTDNDFSAKHTRLWLNLNTDISGHTLKGYVETDFQTSPGTQGSERTTNGYNLALRRAYVQFDNLLVGQDWSTFQNPATLPESTDFVGVTEGTVFVRQPQIRYTKKLSKALALQVAVENPETQTATGNTAALVEQDDDRIPDFVTRLNLTSKLGDFAIAGLLRQLSYDTGLIHDRATGWGFSGSGKIPLGKMHDLRFMATYGKGLGRYVGLNFSPDAIIDPAGQIRTPTVFAGFAALKLGLSPTVRTNWMVSYQNVDYPGGFAAGYFNAYNDSAISYAGNIFWSPAKGFDLGVEYRHGQRKIVSGASGQLDRFEFAAKYNF